MITKSGIKLEEVIKKAMADLKITTAEYNEIMNVSHADGHIDKHEEVLLKEFHSMLQDGVIERVAQ